MKLRSHRYRGGVIVVATIMMLTVGIALAASPKAGNYKGTTNAPKVNGYSAPVSFKVSGSGKQLQHFQYADGCFASGTKPKGDTYTSEFHSLGTMSVSGGKFSVKNVNTTTSTKIPTGGTLKTVTTSSVKGEFTSATKATGTITFDQTEMGPGGFKHSCPSSVSRTFTATKH